MLENGWIERVGEDPQPDEAGRPRKTYALTERGQRLLAAEKSRLRSLLAMVAETNGGGGKIMASIQGLAENLWDAAASFPQDFQNEFKARNGRDTVTTGQPGRCSEDRHNPGGTGVFFRTMGPAGQPAG